MVWHRKPNPAPPEGEHMKLIRYACLPAMVALALAFAGCGDDGKKDAENKQKVENALAKLPGSRNATVAVKGDTLTITNFKAEIPYAGMGTNVITVDELKAEGVDFDAATKTGVVPVAKKVVFKNYRSTMDMKDAGMGGAGSVSGTVAGMEFANLQLDAAAMDKALAKDAPTKDLVAALLTFKGDSSSMQNYRADVNMGFVSGSFAMDKASSGAFSMMSCKDMVAENFKLVFLGSEMFSMGKLSIKNFSMPDVFTPFMNHYDPKAVQTGEPFTPSEGYEKDLADALKKNPILLQGIVMENVQVRPMTNEPLAAKKITMDIEFTQDRIIFKKEVDSLVIPPSVYGKGFEGKALATVYGKPFDLSGAVDFEAVKEGDGGRIALKALRISDKNLGNLDFALKGGFAAGDKDVPAVPQNPDDMKMNELSLTLKDQGAIDLAFALNAEEAKTYDPKATKGSIRDEMIQELSATGAEGSAQRKVAVAFADFLKNSGTFTMKMAPTTPVTFDALGEIMNGSGEALNLTVSATK